MWIFHLLTGDSDLFKNNVTLTFKVEDPNAHKSSSGLKYAIYSVYVDGKEKIKDPFEYLIYGMYVLFLFYFHHR